MNDQPITLEIKNLSCERQDQLLFENLTFSVKAGQLVRVNGKNGSGKSSLLKIITGLLAPLSGEVNWNQQNIKLDPTSYAQALTYIGHKSAIKPELSVIENIQTLLGLRQQSVSGQSINETLELLELSRYEEVEAGHLSQGQQRRIALARLWLEDTCLWVLDEPYVALDKDAISLLTNQLNHFLKLGHIIILTSHQDIEHLDADILDIRLD